MKITKIFFFLLVLFGFTAAVSQNDPNLIEEGQGIENLEYNNWRPYTFELNFSNLGHGISFEKKLYSRLYLRTGASLNYNPDAFKKFGYKLNFGALVNIINEGSFSVRTGMDIGVRSEVPELIFIGQPSRASKLFLDFPLLLQYRISEKLSIDLGIRALVQLESNIFPISNFSSSSSRPPVEIDERINAYHLGLRYTLR